MTSEELSLFEYIAQLPKCHLAHKQFMEIMARIPNWTFEEREFVYDNTTPDENWRDE